MPLTAPLALWIVYFSNEGEKTSVTQFSLSLLLGLLPALAGSTRGGRIPADDPDGLWRLGNGCNNPVFDEKYAWT